MHLRSPVRCGDGCRPGERLDIEQRDLLPRIAVPTVLIWGELDVRSRLSVAHQFEQAIPDAKLDVVPDAATPPIWRRPNSSTRPCARFCRKHSALKGTM